VGAVEFAVPWEGSSAQAAFEEAVSEARASRRDRGYRGTIAAKHGFVVARGCPAGMAALGYARALEDASEETAVIGGPAPLVTTLYGDEECAREAPGRYRVSGGAGGPHYYRRVVTLRMVLTPSQLADHEVWSQKYGPALAIPDGPGRWVFCGLAAE
jgi:hypothetical protein